MFRPLKEFEPATPGYREIKEVLLGIPIPAMPRKGMWDERLDFVAKKADEYPLLESRDDMIYFRAVANSLINSMKHGFLKKVDNADRTHESAKSAVNSIVYLLDRSEQAIRAA